MQKHDVLSLSDSVALNQKVKRLEKENYQLKTTLRASRAGMLLKTIDMLVSLGVRKKAIANELGVTQSSLSTIIREIK